MAKKGRSSKNSGNKKSKANRVNLYELQAYKEAYGERLDGRDYYVSIIRPACLFAFFSFIVTYYWWVAAIAFLVGGLYGYTRILPRMVKKGYIELGYGQRNKFLNNMAQILTNEHKTITQALEETITRAEGEFKDDLAYLHANLSGANRAKAREVFEALETKYAEDIVFCQFVEQLETTFLEGLTNIDTLKDLRTYHNTMQEKRAIFEKAKKQHVSDFGTLGKIVIVMIFAITFSFGFDKYVDAFAHHPIGWVVSTIFLGILMKMYTGLQTKVFDDSVTEVKL